MAGRYISVDKGGNADSNASSQRIFVLFIKGQPLYIQGWALKIPGYRLRYFPFMSTRVRPEKNPY